MRRLETVLLMCLLLGCASTVFAQKAITKPVKPVKTTTARNNSSRQVQVSSASGTINGHEYVDLGLSVKWATCNVGAYYPTGYGNYYAWGETTTKSNYSGNTSKTHNKVLSDISGSSFYDIAQNKWGDSWRLPTEAEIEELVNKCHFTWTTIGGTRGYVVTGPNGKSIFLPVAGWFSGSSPMSVGSSGRYWSSTPIKNDTRNAYCLIISSGVCQNDRYLGLSVRPVSN